MWFTRKLPPLNRDALRAYLRGMSLGFDPLPVSNKTNRVLTDEQAMRKDWEAVGNDMRATFGGMSAEDKREGR